MMCSRPANRATALLPATIANVGHAADRERLDVIRAEEDDDVGLGLVEHLAQLLHRRAGLIELLRVLVRRTREHVRGMARPDGRDDFSHGPYLSLSP